MPDSEQESRDSDARRGDGLGATSTAELPGEEPSAHHDQSDGQGRGQPQANQRFAEQLGGHPCERRGQRRLVVVAERELFAGANEVQLVAVVAISAADGHQHAAQHHRETRERSPRDGRTCELWRFRPWR